MELSNRVLASFLLVFIISILFGTQWTLNEIDKLTGKTASDNELTQVSVTIATVCGDNITFQTEQCDGTNITNTTCITRGFDAGTLACYSNCTFNTSSCTIAAVTNVTVAAAAAGRDSQGQFESLSYNSLEADTYDFAITRARLLYIIFKGEVYYLGLEVLTDYSTRISITSPNKKVDYFDIGLGQTIILDLDEDGVFDFYLTLTDILTRRAVFHLEKFKPVSKGSSPKIGIQVPKFEQPTQITDYADYYKLSFLLLAVIILAIINFAIFRKFIVSKK